MSYVMMVAGHGGDYLNIIHLQHTDNASSPSSNNISFHSNDSSVTLKY